MPTLGVASFKRNSTKSSFGACLAALQEQRVGNRFGVSFTSYMFIFCEDGQDPLPACVMLVDSGRVPLT